MGLFPSSRYQFDREMTSSYTTSWLFRLCLGFEGTSRDKSFDLGTR
jgi:hypothetical protein